MRLNALHGKHISTQLLNDFLNKKIIDIEKETKLWIREFSKETKEGTFYYAINKEFRENNFFKLLSI